MDDKILEFLKSKFVDVNIIFDNRILMNLNPTIIWT